MAQKYSFYRDLPSWAKGVFVIGVGVVGYIILNKVYKGIKGASDKAKESKTTKDIDQELKDLQTQGVKKSFANSQYKAWADVIQQQFDGCDSKQNVFDMSDPLLGWAGTFSGSGKLVAGIFNQLKNNTDFAALVAAYGVRTYDQCGLWTGNVTGNIYKAFADELDEGERRELNKKLATKGITYKI